MRAQDVMENLKSGQDPQRNEPAEPRKGKQGPRKRVSQACDRCRSRKDKCDGARPACSTCSTNGRVCSYDANVKKRGLPEGYVRGLEKLWGLAIREVEEVEPRLLSVLSDHDGDGKVLNIWNDDNNSEVLVEAWRKSQISQEFERLLSNPDHRSDGTKRKREDFPDYQNHKRLVPAQLQHAAEESNNEPPAQHAWPEQVPLHQRDGFQESPISMGAYSTPMQRDTNTILQPSTLRTSGSVLKAESCDLPSETWHLLDVYFSYTHPWLPILEKKDLLRTSYQYSQKLNAVPLNEPGSGDHAALWAAIAYAKFQHRAINNIPHAQGPVADMVWTAERMYAQARALIPNEEGTFELGHVQALIILALTNLGIDQARRAWLLIGQAVRVAIELGFDQSMDDILSALKSKSRNKHVFLGCFVVDTIIAARLGYRPHLRADDIFYLGLVEEDGLDEWDPWTDCLTVRRGSSISRAPASILSTFNRLVEVLQILNQAICAPSGCDRSKVSIELSEKLHAWSRSQSPPVPCDPMAMGERTAAMLPQQYNLHITYCNTLLASQSLTHTRRKVDLTMGPSIRSARQISELLKLHHDHFGLLIVPPTYEYFVKTAYTIFQGVNSDMDGLQGTLKDWKYQLDNCLDAMKPAWPIFDRFERSSTYGTSAPPLTGRRQSQVAYDLMNGVSSENTPLSERTPSSSLTYNTTVPRVGTSQSTQMSVPHRTNNAASPMSHRTTSFGQASDQTFNRSFQRSPQPIYNTEWPQSTPRPQPLQSQSQSLVSTGSEYEFDPMFQELAALDATEWTSNWNQGLQNLGFTDPDNMNRDFLNMSRQPDPLSQNSIFQQLVSSNGTEFFDASAFNGMGSFLGMGFTDESEGIEAGQILQALSAAENPRRGNG